MASNRHIIGVATLQGANAKLADMREHAWVLSFQKQAIPLFNFVRLPYAPCNPPPPLILWNPISPFKGYSKTATKLGSADLRLVGATTTTSRNKGWVIRIALSASNGKWTMVGIRQPLARKPYKLPMRKGQISVVTSAG